VSKKYIKYTRAHTGVIVALMIVSNSRSNNNSNNNQYHPVYATCIKLRGLSKGFKRGKM